MKTKQIKVYDSLGRHEDAEVGDLVVCHDGSTFIWHGDCWNQIRLTGEEKAQFKKEFVEPYTNSNQDFDRAMKGISGVKNSRVCEIGS